MAEKRFREDLYYSLSRVEIRLPRLADRKQDLPLLIRHFLQQFAQQYNKVCQGLTPRAELAGIGSIFVARQYSGVGECSG